MICQWLELIKILPAWMREEVDKQGRDELQELRLRIGHPPQLLNRKGALYLTRRVTEQDLKYVINIASNYSPWAASTTARGYITIPGGHRIGICGEVVVKDGNLYSFREITSLCMRVAKDFQGIASRLGCLEGSVLIIGSPGCGKTTLLRDLIRQRGKRTASSIAVVDERGELFPFIDHKSCFLLPQNIDVLQGCCKEQGIDMVVRTMGPDCVAVDEITSVKDCEALLQTARCGVHILATAHARSMSDLCTRPIYKNILETKVFDHVVTLNNDKTYRTERMNSLC